MQDLKRAIYAAIVDDVPIMAKLGGQPPFPGRLHESAVISKTKAAIVMDGQTLPIGVKDDAMVNLRIMSLSSDLVEAVYEDLRRLFSSAGRAQWTPLNVIGGAAAWIRVRQTMDLPESDSPVFVKLVIFKVLVARPA